MQSKTILYTVIVVLVVASVVFIGLSHKGAQANPNQVRPNQTNSSQTNQSAKVLFSSSQYATYSYLISGSNLSPQAEAALSGFNMTSSNLKNGSKAITVSIIGAPISKKFTLAPGYKLYIVETSFGDDSSHYDSSLGDDWFIVTDPNGYIVA